MAEKQNDPVADEVGPQQPHRDRYAFLKERWAGFVNYCKRKLHDRRTKKEQQDPTEKAAESTANATWFMALFTVVIAVVGLLQWMVIRAQLNEMRKASDLTEALIDRPIWLTGIKAYRFADPSLGGFGSVDVVLKNAGKQLGTVELAIVSIDTRPGLDLPIPDLSLEPREAGCIDFVLGEITLTAGEQRMFRMICVPKMKFTRIAETVAGKRLAFLKVYLVYFDWRRVAREKATLFLYRPSKDGAGRFVSLGSRDIEVPDDENAHLAQLERDGQIAALKWQQTVNSKVDRASSAKRP